MKARTMNLLVMAAMLATLVVPARPAAGGPDTDEFARVTAYLREHQAATGSPGLAVAVVRGDQVVHRYADGVDGNGAPVTARTPFLLGSVSKSFTALAVLQLVEAGRVDLDAPVRRYLPWLRFADDSTAELITVRQSLTHTTGLPAIAASDRTDRFDNTAGGLERSVRDLATLRPTAPVGQRHRYSDANYLVLGALVEAVSGQSFGGYLRSNVFDPLDMRHAAGTEPEARAAGLPAGHRYYLGRPRRFDAPFDTSGAPYGYLAASVEDLTHYMIAQLNDGRYEDARLLSPQGVTLLHTGQVATGASGRYAMGWRESTLDDSDTRIVWHAGAVPGFFNHLVLVPGSDLGVIVAANSYSLARDGQLAAAAFNVARLMLGGTPAAAPAPDPLFSWLLTGLFAAAALLLAGIAWSLLRAVRAGRRRPASRARIIAVAAGWLVGCAALITGVTWLLPASWDGAGLAQILLWAPDIGHAILAVAGLAAALALLRVVLAGYALTRPVAPAGNAAAGHAVAGDAVAGNAPARPAEPVVAGPGPTGSD
jgi:CubicO group peptidase (beta-lactamase class C family)